MDGARAAAALRQLTGPGGPLDYGPEHSRFLVRVMRELARGCPLSGERVERIAAGLGIGREGADRLLAEVAERDADGDVVGAMGLSLHDTPHRFSVDGVRLATWCALDALFLPAVLARTATVESRSPVSGAAIRLTVGPRRVEGIDPPGAVVSIPVVDPDEADLGSVEAIWGTFCHHTSFFASRAEAARWAAGRDDIAIVAVAEACDAGRQIAARLLGDGA